jgi:uncharacterized protein (TIGR02271 family)
MNATKTKTTAVGVFRDRAHAQQAVRELRQMGFSEDDIGVVSHRDDESTDGQIGREAADEETNAGSGALAGAATGLGLGGLWGLGVVAGALPAIGPVIAGGALAAVLASAATGAAAGGLLGALIGMGIPEEEAEYYQGELERGRTIVTVRANGRYDEAQAVLYRHDAYDVHSKDDEQGAATGRMGERAGRADHERNIELREERLRAAPETRTGEVDIRKEVHTEHEQIDVPVEREEVVVERRPSQPHAARGPVGKTEEFRIPVKEQQARVEKETVSKGDVRVSKRKTRDTERVSDDVRKEDIKVERKGKAGISEPRR